MTPGLVIKLTPVTPWRTGSDSGVRERVEPAYRSDAVYSAVTAALATLGALDDWLDATARNAQGSAVRFTSAFPFLRDLTFIVPPKTVWPPAPSPRIRWKSARYVPLSLVESLLRRRTPDDDRWAVDAASGCLVPAGTRGPFRPAVRSRAAVDRLSGSIEVHSCACLEFAPGAGLWIAAAFAGEPEKERWLGPVQAAFRLLADTGFGGGRTAGWGRSAPPDFATGALPDLLAAASWNWPPEHSGQAEGEHEPAPPPETAHWLLSLFVPAESDVIDWQNGVYSLMPRGGRVESRAGWGQPKKNLNMVEEGSVLLAAKPPAGAAPDVAPDGFPHPVFRAGFAFSIPIPWHTAANHRPVRPAAAVRPGPEAPAPPAEPEVAAEAVPTPEEPRPVAEFPEQPPEAALPAAEEPAPAEQAAPPAEPAAEPEPAPPEAASAPAETVEPPPPDEPAKEAQ